MNRSWILRTRPLLSAGVATFVTIGLSGPALASTEPPADPTESTTAGVSAAPDASAAPGAPGVLAETTYTFADGEYHWSTDYGTVPRAGGDLEITAGGVTLLAVTTGVVGVAGGDGAIAEVGEGDAVGRPEDDETVIGAIDASFGSFTTIDIEAGAAQDGTASFTPGAGDRVVTLSSASVEPGASLDLGSFAADFVYVVVVRGILDASDGTEVLPHGAIAWAADIGPVTLSTRSPNVSAEILVVTVSPA